VISKPASGTDVIEARFFIGGVVPLNIPNSLTILRILLIPLIVGFLVYEHMEYALVTFMIAALTDALDGTIARIANQKTPFGAYLDPLADKLLLMTTFVTVSLLDMVPVWSVILVVSRDAILLTGTLLAHLTHTTIDASPTFLGKATTLCQATYIILVLALTAQEVDPVNLFPLLLTMGLLTVLSGLHYIFRGVNRLNNAEDS